jgi:hypothetical protein
MRKQRPGGGYNADPATRETPLRLDEVEAFTIAGSVRSPEQIAHFMSRVAATIKEQRRRMAELQRDVEVMALERAGREHPMARAIAAMEELTDDERRQLLDQRYLAAMEALQAERDLLERARLAMVSESTRARFAVALLLDDPETSPALKAKLEQVLKQLPR